MVLLPYMVGQATALTFWPENHAKCNNS